jgi:hypothetical protein
MKVSVKAPVKVPVKIPVPRATVFGSSKNQNATKALTPSVKKTPVKPPMVSIAGDNKRDNVVFIREKTDLNVTHVGHLFQGNGSAVKLAKNGKNCEYNAVEVRIRAQRERDQRIKDLRERYKQQKAAGIPIGGLPAFYVPPESRWKI